jgi:hypothetical protein
MFIVHSLIAKMVHVVVHSAIKFRCHRKKKNMSNPERAAPPNAMLPLPPYLAYLVGLWTTFFPACRPLDIDLMEGQSMLSGAEAIYRLQLFNIINMEVNIY